MSVTVTRRCLDFLARDYQSIDRSVSILAEDDACPPKYPHRMQPSVYPEKLTKGEFLQRWHLSLQGEEHPLLSECAVSSSGQPEAHVYRYDWSFGFALLEGYYWNWTTEIQEEGALAIHVALQPTANAPEAIPVLATLTALQPSRNTKSKLESLWPQLPKTAAELAKMVGPAFPAMDYIAGALTFGSNVLESQTATQKNWFLYQFFDERRKCPVIEWRINRQVLREYGPLLRGSLYLMFEGRPSESASIRLLLRPQVRYCPTDDITFIIPTEELPEDRQVALTVKPVQRAAAGSAK